MEKLVMLPGPTNVPPSVTYSMTKPVINHRSPEFSNLYKGVVDKSKQLFQTSGDVIIFSASGTGGVEAAVGNLVRKGDTVVVPVFGEFSSRVADSVELFGGKALKVESPFGTHPPVDEIEEALRNSKGAKALVAVCNETSTGVTLREIRKLGEAAHKFGAFFVVDAVSILGGVELPVDDWEVDVCVTGSQKCLAAPPGLALVSLNQRVREYLRRDPPSLDYFDIPKYLKYMERWETPYTPALPLYYALDEALRLVFEEGLEKRYRRHTVCSDALYSGFSAMGIEAFASPECRSKTVIALTYPKGVEDRAFRNLLDDKFGILVTGGFGEMKGKLFRVGCMGEVSAYHVLRTVSGAASALGLLGIPSDAQKALSFANERLQSL